MGSSQRLAAVAAVSHARHYYNHTQPDVTQAETTPYTVNVFFVSATLCGVLVAVCAACWRRSPSSDKPEDVAECRGVYTVSADVRLTQTLISGRLLSAFVLVANASVRLFKLPTGIMVQEDLPGPPPAYDTVVTDGPSNKQCHTLEEVVTEPCPRCETSQRCDSGLPSYEAAVLLKDTKL